MFARLIRALQGYTESSSLRSAAAEGQAASVDLTTADNWLFEDVSRTNLHVRRPDNTAIEDLSQSLSGLKNRFGKEEHVFSEGKPDRVTDMVENAFLFEDHFVRDQVDTDLFDSLPESFAKSLAPQMQGGEMKRPQTDYYRGG